VSVDDAAGTTLPLYNAVKAQKTLDPWSSLLGSTSSSVLLCARKQSIKYDNPTKKIFHKNKLKEERKEKDDKSQGVV
jgi:hypothetical protein